MPVELFVIVNIRTQTFMNLLL